uniref:Uncharacterized protein n=1 Tax=Rhipicephalus microplus TaxID=6941 RepID=A0A6G5AF98_RHIMP
MMHHICKLQLYILYTVHTRMHSLFESAFQDTWTQGYTADVTCWRDNMVFLVMLRVCNLHHCFEKQHSHTHATHLTTKLKRNATESQRIKLHLATACIANFTKKLCILRRLQSQPRHCFL